MSCFSCRAFFRRSIQNNTAGSYQCRRSSNCTINVKTRRNCQWCRYERCLAVGMKPSWVLSTDERERRFNKNKEKKSKTKGQQKTSPQASPPPCSSPPRAVVLALPAEALHIVTMPVSVRPLVNVKTDLFPVSQPQQYSPPQQQSYPPATIQMISAYQQPQIQQQQYQAVQPVQQQSQQHQGVIVRQWQGYSVPVDYPAVDLRVKQEAMQESRRSPVPGAGCMELQSYTAR